MEVLRIAAMPLAPCLSVLFNSCLDAGIYPLVFKTSKVSPLFKGKGTRESLDGYRPVSIIPALAKVFENGVSTRLTKYLADTDALSERQYAYRAGRSTTSLAREVVRLIVDACERRQRVAVLCCDLSKAFDVADHGVLAAKLRHYGIDGPAHALLTDLLRNRSQVVVGNGGDIRSDPLTTVMGVAQGSSVSNILFSLLLNDLPVSATKSNIFMYADDVAAIVTADTVDGLEEKFNEAAEELARWFQRNGLVLNISKTHFIHFSISGRSSRSMSVCIGGTSIHEVLSTTFLGFELDRGLTWAAHVDKLCKRLGSACYALGRLARLVPADMVRMCYFATVHSLLQYGAELFGRAAERERVFRMQKRAIRAIVRVSRRTSVRPYFAQLNIMTFPSIVISQVAVHVRRNIGSFPKQAEMHCYNTRNAAVGWLVPTARRLAKSDRLTHVMGPATYNKLPEKVKDAPNLDTFKKRLSNWLIKKTFYTYDEFINE